MAVSALRRVGNLPVDVTSFIGRRHEVAEAKRLLSTSRLVTLAGVGGVGKTRLALHVAAQVQRAFPDGVWLVELASLGDPGLLAQTVATALDIRDQSARRPVTVLSDHLADRQLLLVLDNCEHLLDACATVADPLLRAAPGLRILATSRQALGMDGEVTFRISPLPVPDPDRLPAAESMGRYESIALFVERAAAVVPGFAVTADNAAVVARLCARLDGIPLAIELATVRLRALSATQILDRLDDRFRLLSAGSRSALPRQQTLRALIDWSFDLCSEQEQTLWARTSVFSDGFDLEAAESVCSGDGTPRDDIFELVAGLVDKSVLTTEERASRVRYRLPETLRQYGSDRLHESGREAALRRRHRDYYQHLAEEAADAWFGPDQLAWFTGLQLEHANLRAALEFCLAEPGEAESGLVMAADLRVYWHASGFLTEGRRWLDRLLACATSPTPARAEGLWVNAWLALMQNDGAAVTALLEECRSLARQLGEPSVLAHLTLASGVAAMYGGDLRQAAPILEDALARHRAIDDRICVAITLVQLALLAEMLSDADRAVVLAEECRATSEAAGELWYRAHACWVLGIGTWLQGDRHRATDVLRKGIQLQRAFHSRLGAARCIEVLAWVAAADARYERAATLLGASQAIWQATGARLSAFGPLAGHHDSCEGTARRALGEKAFLAACERGAGLGFNEIVAYALEEKANGPHASAPATPVRGSTPLTPREREIAELIARGLSNKEIAANLVISLRTAEGHVEHILTKLGFSSRTQVAGWFAGQETRRSASR